MLGLWARGTLDISHETPRGMITWLTAATDVTVTQQINQSWDLEFKYPKDAPGADYIKNGFGIVECEGQAYVIESVAQETDGPDTVKCRHVFYRNADHTHIPNIGSTDTDDTISIAPYDLMKGLPVPGCACLSPAAVKEMGMEWIGTNPAFTIDFESVDKTTLLSAAAQVIENAGQGEIYVDNEKYAIVKRIGNDRDIIISTANFARSVSVQYDYSDIITRLYPYGKDDLTIANAAKNDGKTPYIDSQNRIAYATDCGGYKDYSDIVDADKLWERAMWEFDEDNPDRIDAPKISITGTVIDIFGKTGVKIGLGDGVWVADRGVKTYVRCIGLTHYPDRAELDSVQLGQVQKDAFFYLNQLGRLAKRYKESSTYKGKIQGKKISGTVPTANIGTAQSAKEVSTSGGGISIKGNVITILGNTLTVSDGKLCFNGKELNVKESEG